MKMFEIGHGLRIGYGPHLKILKWIGYGLCVRNCNFLRKVGDCHIKIPVVHGLHANLFILYSYAHFEKEKNLGGVLFCDMISDAELDVVCYAGNFA